MEDIARCKRCSHRTYRKKNILRSLVDSPEAELKPHQSRCEGKPWLYQPIRIQTRVSRANDYSLGVFRSNSPRPVDHIFLLAILSLILHLILESSPTCRRTAVTHATDPTCLHGGNIRQSGNDVNFKPSIMLPHPSFFMHSSHACISTWS